MNSHKIDIAIIGGGIVGMATAMALARHPQISLMVLEAEDRLAVHQTGNNSGVIHAGLYYQPGSLKAENCTQGRQALYRFCRDNDIPHERCGKVVVATHENQIPRLEDLQKRGQANGVEGIRLLSPEELREYEPHLSGIKGLWVPETGIVDFVRVTRAFAEKVRTQGGEIRTNARVIGVHSFKDEFQLETPQGAIACRALINCAGLQCDRIAKMCKVHPGIRIIPFRGEYYRLTPEYRSLVKNLIYPVPDPKFPFLGVHLTRMIDGCVEAGPNAVLSLKREGYHKTSFSLRDTLSTFSYTGFWKMSLKYGKTGIGEFYRSFNKRAFLKALQKLVPELEMKALQPGGAGVRAQAVEPSGKLVDDFRIIEGERMIHVLNAPSPAATASISIGETIAEKALKNFGYS